MSEPSIFDTFAKGAKTSLAVRGTNCVIYTRVSTKEQADTNLSLDTQRKACDQYARKHAYSVHAYFGGTFESAQTDERKEFSAMLSYVKKCREHISFIIVYSLDRFSRNDNSIWLSSQLRKLGTEIVSVTQPIDFSSPSGKMQQRLLMVFNQFDNELRRDKCMAGVKEMLLRGDWPTMPPLGYDTVRINNKRSLVINDKGKLLRQAFRWKAEEGLSSEAVRARLAEKGLKLNHQRIPEIFRNPFYCGMMVHNMLEGRAVAGNHEPLVSKELFLRVNGLLDKNTHGYKIIEENEAIPLKRFIHCDCCGKPLRGYIVKKKNLHYYKCNTVGCGNNKSAASLNQAFARILEYFQLDLAAELMELIKQQTVATFNQLTKGHEDARQLLQKDYREINNKIERLDERYIEEEINGELYKKYSDRYRLEKKEIEDNLLKASNKVSNLEECVDMAIGFATKLPSRWLSADYFTKQQIQFLIFPEGLRYNRQTDGCRTTRVNSVFAYIAYLKQVFAKEKSGIPELNLEHAALVARRGIEPRP